MTTNPKIRARTPKSECAKVEQSSGGGVCQRIFQSVFFVIKKRVQDISHTGMIWLSKPAKRLCIRRNSALPNCSLLRGNSPTLRELVAPSGNFAQFSFCKKIRFLKFQSLSSLSAGHHWTLHSKYFSSSF